MGTSCNSLWIPTYVVKCIKMYAQYVICTFRVMNTFLYFSLTAYLRRLIGIIC